MPTVVSQGVAFAYERGTPVLNEDPGQASERLQACIMLSRDTPARAASASKSASLPLGASPKGSLKERHQTAGEREFLIGNLMVRIHFFNNMISVGRPSAMGI